MTSGIVPIRAAATEGVVQLPADLKLLSKLLGAWACRAAQAQRKVLEHVALGHGNHVVQHKSPPLIGVNLLPATAAVSPPMSMEATSPSPPFGKLLPPPARRSPRVEVQVVPVIQGFLAVPVVHMQTRFFYRVQDVPYVPLDKGAVTLCSTACWEE